MVALALRIVALVLVVMVMVLVLVLELLHLGAQAVFVHRGEDLRPAELLPRGGDEPGLGVDCLEKLRRLGDLLGLNGVGAAEDQQVRARDLVVEELAEVAHVHLGLAGVDDGDLRADVRALDALDRGGDVGELAHARGLDEDAVGGEVGHHFFEGLGEVAHQRAADAAGVHLGDLHARVLQERAVNGDLAELVFDQDQLFILIAFRDQLADQSRLTGSEKAGKNINSSQSYCLLCKLLSKCLLYHLLFCFTRLLPQSHSDSSGFVLTGRSCYAILSCNFLY